MNEKQKAKLDQHTKQKRGSAIIEGNHEERLDGYTNMLNKAGTKQDNSTAYSYNQEPHVDDMQLIRLYEGNGLFAKIIDRPAEETVKHGLDIDFGDEDISEYVDDRLDELGYEENFATAEKWARLYGGSIIVMLVDDGRGLEEPLDWDNVRKIEELRVFERAIVQPDYSNLYNFHFMDSIKNHKAYGEPEYYQVFSIYGYFKVHRTRCLVFRNGKLPEHTTNALYRYWGIPEYVKIKRALRECITSHEDGVKLLERSVQAIYKMKNLANMLSTADGEDKVLQRLQVIDMARGILNSIAIDNEGEDYDFKNLSLSGVKDIIESTCNMLSAVTNIPQTILFGRSPAGMNSTGESDFENYYNMVENIQKQNMKANTRKVIDLILRQGKLEGRIEQEPRYKVKFAALWSMSEAEQASVEQTKAQTEYTKAQTAQIYMDSSVIDPSEVRQSIAKEGSVELEELVPGSELDIPEDTFDVGETISISGVDVGEDEDDNIISIQETETDDDDVISIQVEGEMDADKIAETNATMIRIQTDEVTYPATAVLVVQDGKILCATRADDGTICGPGGHVEEGETVEEAVVREAIEEFDIVPLNLIHLGDYKASYGLYLPSKVYFTDEFSGTPKSDNKEMINAQWLSLEELRTKKLFPPFEESLNMLEDLMLNYLTTRKTIANIKYSNNYTDGGRGSGNYGHGGRKGKVGGSTNGGKGRKSSQASQQSKSNQGNQTLSSSEKLEKRIVGMKTSAGVTVTGISYHAQQRIKQRKMSPGRLEKTLKSNDFDKPGKEEGTTDFFYDGCKAVVTDDGNLKTIMWGRSFNGRGIQ